jgi:TorA maturation chaperone TorD
MNTSTQSSAPFVEAEEQARADFYGLLSRLFAAPADAELLRGIASGPLPETRPGDEVVGDFMQAWRELVAQAGTTDAAAAADEYNDLFVASGRAEISLYIGAYTARSSVDTPLVALRSWLASRGLQRQSGVHEPEDHAAIVFEIMRYLIAEARSGIDQQKIFFDTFLWNGGLLLCDAISEHRRAQFYRPVARFAKSFLSVEHDAFDMGQ